MKTKIQVAAFLLIVTLAVAQTPVVPGSILGSLTPITSSNGTLNAVFPVVINTGAPAVLVQLDQTTTITAGAIRFQVSYDGTNFVNTSTDAVTDPTSTANITIGMPYLLAASTNKAFIVNMKGAQALQILVSTAMTGTGSITPYYSITPTLAGSQPSNLIALSGAAISSAASGVQKVGVTGSAGGAFDAAGENVAAPANQVIVGGKFSTAPSQITSGRVSPIALDQIGDTRVMAGGNYVSVFSSTSSLSTQTSSLLYVGSALGSLNVAQTGWAGSPSGCKIQELVVDAITGANASIAATISLATITTVGDQTFAVNPNGVGSALNVGSALAVKFQFSCTVYPTGSPTMTVEFVPTQGVSISGSNGNALSVTNAGAAAVSVGDIPSIVQSVGNVTSSGTTVDIVITPSGAGNTLVALCGVNNTGTLSVSDTLSLDTWNPAKSQTGTVAGSLISFAVSASKIQTTVRCTAGTSGVVVGYVYEVSGLLAQVPEQPDVTDSNTGSSQTTAALNAGIVPDTSNEIAFAAPVLTTNNTCTAAGSWTIDTQEGAVGGRLCPSRQALADTDKVSGNVASFTSANYAMAVAAFRAPVMGIEGTVQLFDGTTKVGVIAGTTALKSDVSSVAGTATDANSGNKSNGTLRVVLATDQPQLTNKLLVTPDPLAAGTAVIGKVGIDQTTPGTTNAIESVPDTASAVAVSDAVKLTVTSSVSIKASAGNVYGVSANNGAAVVCWVQFINSAGAGTLGSGVIFSVAMPASGTVTIPPGALALGNFSTGIAVGIASVTNSSSACGTAGNITVFYK